VGPASLSSSSRNALTPLRQTHHVSNYVPDERPIRVGSTYRLLFGAPLADLVRLRVTAYAPPREIEWSGVGHLRRLRLRLQLSPVAHSPKQRTRIDAQWWWQWLGWRRVPGLARDAHLAARAVAASTQLSLPAALAQL